MSQGSPVRDAKDYYNDGMALFTRGNLNKAQVDEAIVAFTKALEIDPRYSAAYANRGAAFLAIRQYDRAIADFTKFLDIEPGHAGIYTNRAVAYEGTGEIDKAIADFSKALEINPKQVETYVDRGLLYVELKNDFPKAISDFNKALELEPRNATAYFNRAIAYYKLKDYDKAWDDVHKAQGLGLEIDSWFIEALRVASARTK